MANTKAEAARPETGQIFKQESLWELFLIFTRLGLSSFGGPVAHLGYFRAEFVFRRQWLSEQSYADLVAMCQFLPGPASSQVGMAMGIFRHGYAGALAAWAGFTLPSAMFLILLAMGISAYGAHIPAGWLHGLKVVAVAVVAQAVWGMYRSLCKGWIRTLMMLIATGIAMLFTGTLAQLGIMIIAGIFGFFVFDAPANQSREHLPVSISRQSGYVCLSLFFILLIVFPFVVKAFPYQAIADFSAFFRVGSLVFGGGHVVLPLLQTEVVTTGLVSNEVFLAGYGAAQAVPGPLFTFAAFLGASMNQAPTGIAGGLLCLVAIFFPSFLLVSGVLPFWEALRRHKGMQAALAGVNAAVVGLLLAAFFQPVWTSAVHVPGDALLAATAFVALVFGKAPPWLVVLACGVAGAILTQL